MTLDTLILAWLNNKLWFIPAGRLVIGTELITVNPKGKVSVSKVKNIARGTSEVLHVIHTDQGQVLKCSSSHPIIRGYGDTTGMPARRVKVGDTVLVMDYPNRRVVEAKVEQIEVLTMELPADVVTFELEGKDHTFVSDGIVTHNVGYKQ